MLIENDKGEEINVFTQEELDAKVKEIQDNTSKTLAEKEAEIEKYKKVSAEKTENFKRFNELTEAEKEKYNANELEFLKRTDEAVNLAEGLKKQLEEKTANEKAYTKNSILSSLHKGDEATKTALESHYDMLSGMPESTPEEIKARAEASAKLVGIVIDPRNPIYTGFSGEAPSSKAEGKDFVESEKGKEALDLAKKALNV